MAKAYIFLSAYMGPKQGPVPGVPFFRFSDFFQMSKQTRNWAGETCPI